MRVISLGWGVQSFAMAAMSALCDLPPVDYAVHCDTGHECSATYQFARDWTPWLVARGVHVETVHPAEKSAPGVNAWGGVLIPSFTRIDGKIRQLKRQCTDDWKRAPLKRWLQAHRHGERVQLWIGISVDEAHRMKPAPEQYIEHAWPLVGVGVGVLPSPMSRADCVAWLQAHGLPTPPRSRCVFCPYQRDSEWRSLAHCKSDWEQAVTLDMQIRGMRPPGELYLHRTCNPLATLDLSTPEDRGQMTLMDECGGECGL